MNPFAVAGLAVDGLGAALVVAGVIVPGGPRWGLVIAGAALSVIGMTMFLVGRQAGRFLTVAPRLLHAGVPARAVIERVWETGMALGGSPILGFALQVSRDGSDHAVEVRQAVPRRHLGALQPGAALSIVVDPADIRRSAIDWSVPPDPGATGLPPPPAAGGARDPAPQRRESAAALLARGRRGRARITAARRAGTAGALGAVAPDDPRAGDPMLMLDLEVKTPGQAPYPVTVLHHVPPEVLPKVQPGLEVVVAVDRDDPERAVAVDWTGVA